MMDAPRDAATICGSASAEGQRQRPPAGPQRPPRMDGRGATRQEAAEGRTEAASGRGTRQKTLEGVDT